MSTMLQLHFMYELEMNLKLAKHFIQYRTNISYKFSLVGLYS